MPAGSIRSRASGVSAAVTRAMGQRRCWAISPGGCAMTIPTLLLVAIAVFALVRLIPGDPVQVMLGDSADPVASGRSCAGRLGLDQSIPVQFGYWLGKARDRRFRAFDHQRARGAAADPRAIPGQRAHRAGRGDGRRLRRGAGRADRGLASRIALLDLCRRRRRDAAAVDPELLARPVAAAAVRPETEMAAGDRLCPVQREFRPGRWPSSCCRSQRWRWSRSAC